MWPVYRGSHHHVEERGSRMREKYRILNIRKIVLETQLNDRDEEHVLNG